MFKKGKVGKSKAIGHNNFHVVFEVFKLYLLEAYQTQPLLY